MTLLFHWTTLAVKTHNRVFSHCVKITKHSFERCMRITSFYKHVLNNELKYGPKMLCVEISFSHGFPARPNSQYFIMKQWIRLKAGSHIHEGKWPLEFQTQDKFNLAYLPWKAMQNRKIKIILIMKQYFSLSK